MTDDADKEAYKEASTSIFAADGQRLQAAVWHYANQIIEEESSTLETTATPQFISALADLVYAQAGRSTNIKLIVETLAVDLESFAGHANRSVINVDDVKAIA